MNYSYSDERIKELETQSVAMNEMYRNLSDDCRDKLFEIASEMYEDMENRRNPYKEWENCITLL